MFADDYPISELELSARAANVCRENGWTTLGHLRRATIPQMLAHKNCGRKTANEITSMVARLDNTNEPMWNDAAIVYHTEVINAILRRQPKLIAYIEGRKIKIAREVSR